MSLNNISWPRFLRALNIGFGYYSNWKRYSQRGNFRDMLVICNVMLIANFHIILFIIIMYRAYRCKNYVPVITVMNVLARTIIAKLY